jgi:hypothetical protein
MFILPVGIPLPAPTMALHDNVGAKDLGFAQGLKF